MYPQILSMGVHIVTPNKKGFSGPSELYDAINASAYPNTTAVVLGESTVGAGLPILSTLKDLVATGDEIQRIEGVFSGTLSYIFNEFSKVEGGDVKFSDVVKIAKDKGYTVSRSDRSGRSGSSTSLSSPSLDCDSWHCSADLRTCGPSDLPFLQLPGRTWAFATLAHTYPPIPTHTHPYPPIPTHTYPLSSDIWANSLSPDTTCVIPLYSTTDHIHRHRSPTPGTISPAPTSPVNSPSSRV
jgi:hypothetical protein